MRKSYNQNQKNKLELPKECENLPLMKDEKEVIRKLIVPVLKEQYFVRLSVRVRGLHQKLGTEGVLSPEEVSLKHPFRPDIDVLFWAKQYSGEPIITACEVKYFRLRKDTVYPAIYEGLGEAVMLLTFGVDYVCLWHFFDPEIPSETTSRYRELTQNIVSGANLPINYQSWLVPKTSSTQSSGIVDLASRLTRLTAMTLNMKSNPLMYRWDAKIVRSIIKKAYRMVHK